MSYDSCRADLQRAFLFALAAWRYRSKKAWLLSFFLAVPSAHRRAFCDCWLLIPGWVPVGSLGLALSVSPSLSLFVLSVRT